MALVEILEFEVRHARRATHKQLACNAVTTVRLIPTTESCPSDLNH